MASERRRDAGFVVMMRNPDIVELIEASPLSWALVSIIAFRARYRPGISLKGLQPGEAFLGDYKAYGMTGKQYRTVKTKLSDWEFAAFRTTNRGTVARLLDTRLFDVLKDTTDARFIPMMRTPEALALIEASPLAWALVSVIALRARFMPGASFDGLQPGEANISDYKTFGITEQQYRTAKKKLSASGFVAFRATGNKTVAKLMDSRLFDVLNETMGQTKGYPKGKQGADEGQQRNNGNPGNLGNLGNKKRQAILQSPSSSQEVAEPEDAKTSRPESVGEVVLYALTRRDDPYAGYYPTSEVMSWLGAQDFNRPVSEFLEAHEEIRDPLTWAFRFIHYNNRKGWRLTHNWRTAYEGFLNHCLLDSHGVAELPIDWIPHVAGIDS